jgi:hypothetical protein
VIEDEAEDTTKGEASTAAEKKTGPMADSNSNQEAGGSGEGSGKGPESKADASPRASTDLPADVRTKLRKLEKLESRYQGTFISSFVLPLN